jgi:hypothetical protein
MFIAICILAIYLLLLLAWWLICAISAKNAIRSSQRTHFNITEMLDIGLMRFWRFVSYCTLAGLIIWLFLIGKWYFAIPAIFWNIKIYWFGSLFYLPFNLIESHYMAKVAVFFGAKQSRQNAQNRNAQIQKMQEKGWTIPDKMK